MLPKMNPKHMEKMMRQMGINQEEIDASEVIIKTPSRHIIIRNPQVSRIKMQGQESFQISGDVHEEAALSEEDVKTVAEQAKVSLDEARKALEACQGDLAESILSLQD